jgi:uncharacterized protein (DUF1697 family)
MPSVSTRYIAFLRAVNVGGRVVPMSKLRAHFEQLRLADVRTFIQSGNVFFTTKKNDRTALTRRIERHLHGALGFEVPTMLRTIDEVEAALALDPFKRVKITPDVRLSILFVSEPLPRDVKLPLGIPKMDGTVLQATPGEAFVVYRVAAGRVPNPAAYLEKTYRIRATARFFGTTAKILAAAKKGVS